MYKSDRIKMNGPFIIEMFEVPQPSNPQKSPFLDHTKPLTQQTWVSENTARIIYDKQSGSIWYGDAVRQKFRTLSDVPYQAIILFESDTQVLGYELLSNDTDGVVYFTRGSAAGGEAGGSLKSGGSWNGPTHTHVVEPHSHALPAHAHSLNNHYHTSSPHTHNVPAYTLTINEIPAHTHNPKPPGTYFGVATSGYGEGGGNTSGSFQYSGYTGGSESHTHSITSFAVNTQPATGNTSITSINSQASSNFDSSATAIFLNNINPWRPVGLNYTRQRRV